MRKITACYSGHLSKLQKDKLLAENCFSIQCAQLKKKTNPQNIYNKRKKQNINK